VKRNLDEAVYNRMNAEVSILDRDKASKIMIGQKVFTDYYDASRNIDINYQVKDPTRERIVTGKEYNWRYISGISIQLDGVIWLDLSWIRVPEE
jgi:hypothetical protein